jgi:hypothetical protein
MYLIDLAIEEQGLQGTAQSQGKAFLVIIN